MILKKVSFDFDSTLSEENVQEFAKDLVNRGFDVWIVTSRINTESALAKGWYWIKKQNQELYDVANECGIKEENIIFTEFIDKIEFLKDKNFLFHLDDDSEEIDLILESGDRCKGVNVENSDWKEICENILLENLSI